MPAGALVPLVAVLSGAWVAATMVVAFLTHYVRARDPVSRATPAALFLVLALAAVALQWVALGDVLG